MSLPAGADSDPGLAASRSVICRLHVEAICELETLPDPGGDQISIHEIGPFRIVKVRGFSGTTDDFLSSEDNSLFLLVLMR